MTFSPLFSGFQLVSEEAQCEGSWIYDCPRPNVVSCAESCRTISSMFLFGRYGTGKCDANNNCACLCSTTAVNGSCTQESSVNFNLFRMSTPVMPALNAEGIKGEAQSFFYIDCSCFHAGFFAQITQRNFLKFMFTPSLFIHAGCQTDHSRNNAIFPIQFPFSRSEIYQITPSRLPLGGMS